MTDYRTVPMEPTEQMIEAAEAHWLRGSTAGWSRDNPRGIWAAMLSASPAPAGDLVKRVAEVWVLTASRGEYSDRSEWRHVSPQDMCRLLAPQGSRP